MADIGALNRWTPFVPDIGNNRDLPAEQQFVLEVASGLPKETLLAFSAAIAAAPDEGETKDDHAIKELAKHVRVVGGPHTLGGKEIKDLPDYARLCLTLNGNYNLRELFAAVGYFNSISGDDALFSERRSGGTAFMLHRNAALAGNRTDDR